MFLNVSDDALVIAAYAYKTAVGVLNVSSWRIAASSPDPFLEYSGAEA